MINFAHRGASNYYPENTILAIKEGIKAGANGIELDIHKSKDNKLVVIHDEDVQRTFKGKGLVKDFTLNELKYLKCRNNNFRDNVECKIPTLEEVLEIIKDFNITLNIEIKNDQIYYENIERDTIDLLNYYKIKEKVLLSSFNHKSIEICKKLDSSIKASLLCEEKIDNIIDYGKYIGADGIHPDIRLVSEDLIENIKKNDLNINIYTVDSPDIMRKLIKKDVDGIFTNYPDLLYEILNSSK